MRPELLGVFSVSMCWPLSVVEQVFILALFLVPIDMKFQNKKLKCHKNWGGEPHLMKQIEHSFIQVSGPLTRYVVTEDNRSYDCIHKGVKGNEIHAGISAKNIQNHHQIQMQYQPFSLLQITKAVLSHQTMTCAEHTTNIRGFISFQILWVCNVYSMKIRTTKIALERNRW